MVGRRGGGVQDDRKPHGLLLLLSRDHCLDTGRSGIAIGDFKPPHPPPPSFRRADIPFLKRGVPIVHLIASPFPPQWHKESDTVANLDWDAIRDFDVILRAFLAEYYHTT